MSVRFVTIHPFDPWGSKIGGVETAIRSMLQHAPSDFDLAVVGVTEDPLRRPPGRWQTIDYLGKLVCFLPLFPVEQPNQRAWTPLSARFVWRLRKSGLRFDDAVAVYHRVEPIALTRIPTRGNLLCIHGDPREMVGRQSEARWRYIPWLYRLIEMRAVRKSRRLCVVSREGVHYFRECYPERSGEISFLSTFYRDEIFSPVDDTERRSIREKFVERFGFHEAAKLILFAGRWEEQKNPLLAIEVFTRLSEIDEDVHLLLAGGGSLHSRMRSAIWRVKHRNRIHCLGSLSPQALADAMRASDVFLLTSRFEGMPIAVLEAMGCGRPVVSTEVGEIRALIQEGINGRIVIESDPGRLADAVKDILSHPERFSHGVCAKAADAFRPAAILPSFYEAVRTI